MAGEVRPEATPLVWALMHGHHSYRPEPALLSSMLHIQAYSLALLVCLNPSIKIQPIFKQQEQWLIVGCKVDLKMTMGLGIPQAPVALSYAPICQTQDNAPRP